MKRFKENDILMVTKSPKQLEIAQHDVTLSEMVGAIVRVTHTDDLFTWCTYISGGKCKKAYANRVVRFSEEWELKKIKRDWDEEIN